MKPEHKYLRTGLLSIVAIIVGLYLFGQVLKPALSSAQTRFALTPSALGYLPIVSRSGDQTILPTETPGPPTATATPPGPSPTPPAPGDGFLETFDGDPAGPTPWNAPTWDVTVHTRGRETLYTLEGMQADHGTNCDGPPNQHYNETYEGAVFQCRNHVMTALNASDYGLIYLTPNQLVDFSAGEAVVRFDVSTRRTSGRDWWDIWITPYEDHLQLALADWLPDLNGEPRRAVSIEMSDFNDDTIFRGNRVENFDVSDIDGNWWTGYETFLVPSATRRDTFELRISQTHVKFGMPEYDFWWIDTDIPALDWSQGVVQLGHHSYNPWKDGNNGPNTWHWDNVSIDPAVPFTILPAGQRYVESATDPVTFASPAPAGANLRFSGIGEDVEVSFDGGATWQTAQLQDQEIYDEGHFRSYWTPIPAGTSTVHFRAQEWWGGDWHVRDISIWSLEN